MKEDKMIGMVKDIYWKKVGTVVGTCRILNNNEEAYCDCLEWRKSTSLFPIPKEKNRSSTDCKIHYTKVREIISKL